MNKEYAIKILKSIRKKANDEDILDANEERFLTKTIHFLEAMPDYEDMSEDYKPCEDDEEVKEDIYDGEYPF